MVSCIKWKVGAVFVGSLLFILAACDEHKGLSAARQPYPEEAAATIGRGLATFCAEDGGCMLTWRRLPNEPDGQEYIVWRFGTESAAAPPVKIAATQQTHFMDQSASLATEGIYQISIPGETPSRPEQAPSRGQILKPGIGALTFQLGTDYQFVRVATGDLTGDGELEFVIAYSKTANVDPYEKVWKPSENTIKVAAFHRNGSRLWTFDLGPGIETGGVYAPIVVWDLDADGRCEILLKTNSSGNPREYKNDQLSILDGQTGSIVATAPWPIIEGFWADNYNNNSRNFLAVAHLDGINPTVIAGRGLYKSQVLMAYDNQLRFQWKRQLGRHLHVPVRNKYLRKIWNKLAKDKTQGSHCLPVADVDEDGKEELLWGEHCIGENGQDKWVVEEAMPYRGQPDIVFAADIYPDRPGKEIYYCREGAGKRRNHIGVVVVDSKGKTLWHHWGFYHVDGGWVAKIDPDVEGVQCFGYDIFDKNWDTPEVQHIGAKQYLWRWDGVLLTNPPESWLRSFPVDWEGDGVKEICTLDGDLVRYNGSRLHRIDSEPLWAGDLYGDHREEIVLAPRNGKIMILFNTDRLHAPPRITPLADRQYRNDLSRTAMQFNVIPTESGFITTMGHASALLD